jgi:Fur family iron response transcriptional regulator
LTKSKFRLSFAPVKTDAADLLRAHGIQPSAQRIVIARYVLFTDEHPSADKVLARVRAGFPMISRATIYNTLNLFVEKGLLREQHLAPDSIVFDPRTDAHHHFVDEASGRIYDIDWGKVRVSNVESIDGFEVHDYQVVMRGRKKGRAKR